MFEIAKIDTTVNSFRILTKNNIKSENLWHLMPKIDEECTPGNLLAIILADKLSEFLNRCFS
jgi:hypothetical protein